MGEVYRAKDLRLGREIAIKVLPMDLASSADTLARFEREARTVAGLNHPNIVTLFSVEDEDGVRFLTMELVDGQPLSSVIAPGGLPVSRVLELSIPLADALAAAHERGVIHRDLKPGNVMVTREGLLKVLDFGLAKVAVREDSALHANATLELPISHEGEVQGTVGELRATLLGEAADSKASGEVKAEVSRAAKGRGTNPDAHRLYLQARYFIGRDTREGIARAIEYLKQALELEPEFAHAWATLAWAYAEEVDYAWVARAEGSARAHQAVERALELEPDLAEAHATKGWIQMNHGWNWRGAEASFRRALELAPADAAILRRAGVLASTQDRIEDGITLYRRALELDPLDAHGYSNLGLALHAGHREVEAEAAYREALELAPQKIITRAALSLALLAQGRGEEALAEAAREPDDAFRLWALAIVRHGLGHRAESDDALRKLSKQFADRSAFLIAEAYAMRGETDAAFAWLERAHTQRDTGLSEIKWSPEFSVLHEDPRWRAFVKKMGFEE